MCIRYFIDAIKFSKQKKRTKIRVYDWTKNDALIVLKTSVFVWYLYI